MTISCAVRTFLVTALAVVCLTGVAVAESPQSASSLPVTTASAEAQRALLDQYCVTCHNARLQTGGLALEGLNVGRAADQPELWEKVVRKLRGGVMPPIGRPRPEKAAYDGLAVWLETELDRGAAANPNPGRRDTFHRLNRAEYGNAVRELLALDVDVTSLLPADDASYGFDNMAGVLRLSQSVMERYLSAADTISRSAVAPAATPVAETFRLSLERSQYDRADGMPFGTRGGALLHYKFPRDGEYRIKVLLVCTTETDITCDGSKGHSEPHQLEITLDGERVQLFTLEPAVTNYRASDAGVTESYGFEVRVPVTGGPHDVGVGFLKTFGSVGLVRNGYRKRFERPYRFNADVMGILMPFVETVSITGPFNATGPGDTPSRRAVFTCRPTAAADEEGCARTILSGLAKRAYRRPPTESEVEELLVFYREGEAEGGFEQGVQMAIRRMLISLNFLFRIEADPVDAAAGTAYRLNDYELASRLSFFLWSSIPDDELLDAAARGALQDPVELERQVRRMLADDRSSAFVENFAGQWLRLRNLDAVRPYEALFPDFDTDLPLAMRRETELFFQSIVREDRSVLELLTADYTFVNGRLARHYGLPHVRGNEFQRVTFSDDRRRGLLGHASILTVTSPATRTSPVQRGKWILENILGTPPPPPPPSVPTLPEPALGSKLETLSIRERMAAHRENPVCAGCHAVIDPMGFALENFNWVGQWRSLDESFEPVDASGVFPDGRQFGNLSEFRAAIVSNPERFISTLTEKLLTYAIGRGVEYYDMPAVRKIGRNAAEHGYGFGSVILGIVTSDPFQMRRAPS